MPRKIDIRLGQLLVQKQWCTLRQITEALESGLARQGSGGRGRGLAQVLIARGILDEKRVKHCLADLGALVLSCPECAQDYAVSEYDPESSYPCHQCGALLDLGEPSEDRQSLIPYHSSTTFAMHPATFDPAFVSPAGSSPSIEPSGPDPYIGKVLGGCKLVEKIAAGGMGVVYRAQQLNLNRTVAVKVLSRDLSNDESFVRRFIEEARSAAQLSHGNIVHINDVGDYHGIFYFTMEYVDGVDLKKLFNTKRSPLPVPRSLEITRQVCAALQHAHRRGIIHRDIKPENIMITRDGVVKLADLGLAKQLTSGVENLTQAGSILGTPYYMAPEQARDFSQVDERSDIYSLGVTLYKMLTGRVPYTGRTPIEVMVKAVEGRRPSVRSHRQDVPAEVERIVDRMMHRNPNDRYQDVDELINDLDKLLGESRDPDVAPRHVDEHEA